MGKVRALLQSKLFIYVILCFFALFLACISKDYDYDLYARLIVGEHFFKTGWISYEDFLSYTPTHIWYDHEWGASVIFYAFFKLFGNFGLVLAQAITIFFTTFFIIKTQEIQTKSYPFSMFFILGFMFLFAHQNPSIVRCHMFSFMFLSMFIYFLEKNRLHNSNLIWLVPFLTIVWNNIHGGVVSGLGMIFIYMIGELISKRPWRKYLYVLLVATPLLVINPYGVEYLDFLFAANTMNRKYITEWWGVFVQRHVVYYYPLFCTAMFTIILAFINFLKKEKLNITKVLALLITAYLGISHVKLLSTVLVVVASLYYNDIIRLFDKNCIKRLNKFATTLAIVSIFYIPFTSPTIARTHPKKFPVSEVEFIKQNNIKGNILTSFGLGSYTSYKLYPNNLIYMDGRYEEVYYDKEFDNLMAYEQQKPNWDDVLNNYPTEILMPEIKNPVYKKLQENKNWEEVYTGTICGVFLQKNRTKYKPPFKQPSSNVKYYQVREFDNFGKFGE